MYLIHLKRLTHFDENWLKFLELIPKFANSHYHDIITYACGLTSFLILLVFRPTIKQCNRNHIMSKYNYDLFHRENPQLRPIMIYRLCNLVIPMFAGAISMTCYSLVARYSFRISMHSYWFYVAGLIPIAIYTIYEFLQSNVFGWIFTFGTIYIISKLNTQYCMEFEDHHKACYAVKYTMVVFGIIGIVKQFAPPLKDIITFFKNKRNISESSHTNKSTE